LDQVSHVWKDVREMLGPSVERSSGRWTLEHLFHALMTGRHQLWVIVEDGTPIAAITTEIVEYPATKMLAFQFLGGTKFDLWFEDTLYRIETFAKECGCTGTEGIARFGFKPWMTGAGYDMHYAVYDKVFEEKGDE
jgi:hypothetical protein